MIIGDRLRAMREEKNLSQGDIEKRTDLLRCYISRVENGHAVPAIETLAKLARAMEIPLYQLFYEGEEPPALPNLFFPCVFAALILRQHPVLTAARALAARKRVHHVYSVVCRNFGGAKTPRCFRLSISGR